ncbi:uncharacterized protein LOC106963775 [Poecilia latipinna]|uniref:uncharacterized protein LOC106963775 n=1 Tax=Poecilia latipinna TaxID=48699 RepID=UPI00072E0891|nr:PREDICTED: uncharacterized protein LOC106963775 [Poecilia latipinna]
MDPERKQSSSPSLSMMTDHSKEDLVNFTVDERNSQGAVADEINTSPTDPSLRSYRSKTPPPDFSNVIPSARLLPVGGLQTQSEKYSFTLPQLIEDWTKDQVKDWDQPGYTPVILLVDNWEDVEDLKQCILHVAGERRQQNALMVIILNYTVGQVYKSQLKKKIEDSEPLTAEALDECLILGSKAVKAFQESQVLAKKDETIDPFDLHNRKRPKSYNTSAYLGDIRSGCSREQISFYLGFTMEGPVAYNIKYVTAQ